MLKRLLDIFTASVEKFDVNAVNQVMLREMGIL